MSKKSYYLHIISQKTIEINFFQFFTSKPIKLSIYKKQQVSKKSNFYMKKVPENIKIAT